MVFTENPFAAVTVFFSPLAMQIYIVLMVLAVVIGTLFDVHHKGSAKFFARRKDKSRAAAKKQLSGTETFSLAVETVAEAAVSGEFCKWPRRISHLLMMYGFFTYVITTIVMGVGMFTGIILSLVGLLLVARGKLVASGNVKILVNDDESKAINTAAGGTLLGTLASCGIARPC